MTETGCGGFQGRGVPAQLPQTGQTHADLVGMQNGQEGREPQSNKKDIHISEAPSASKWMGTELRTSKG